MTLVAVRPLSPIHLSLSSSLTHSSFSIYHPQNRLPITLPHCATIHQCFPSALAPLAESTTFAPSGPDHRTTAFWKHAARCQQRQRRRKNPGRNFAARVPVKVNPAHTQNDPKAPNTNERRPRNAGFQSRVMDMVQRGPADCHQPIVRLPRSLHMHHTPAQPQPESPKANSHRNLQLPSPNAED
jgi:hypothetical protein